MKRRAEGMSLEDLERELNAFLRQRLGGQLHLNIIPPQAASERSGEGESSPQEERKASGVCFDLKPEELEAYLDEYVVKQREAKEVLATKICTHFHRIRLAQELGPDRMGYVKNNILLIGPSGVGKTYLVKLIARKIGVPFVKADATKFSETGYVGGDVEDLIRDLVQEADGDVELAQYGIVYLDEIDKIAASGSSWGPDVSRTGVQRSLLKPMEETEVDLRVPHDLVSQMEALEEYRRTGRRVRRTINTRYILFIMSGAFYGLEEIVRRRLGSKGMGFGAEIRGEEERLRYLKQVKAEDLVAYGFESEFVARLPVIVVLDPLDVEDLYQILKRSKNPIVQGKRRDFRSYGIDLTFEDEALCMIARQAHREGTGARALVRVMERVLLKFEKRLPSTDLRRLVVTPELVTDPQGYLERLLADPSIQEERFQAQQQRELSELRQVLEERRPELERRFGVDLPPERMRLVVERMQQRDQEETEVLEELRGVLQEVRALEEEFQKRTGLRLRLSQEATDALVRRAWRERRSLQELFQELFRDYEHGLKLVGEEVELRARAVEDPQGYLEDLIRRCYARAQANPPDGGPGSAGAAFPPPARSSSKG